MLIKGASRFFHADQEQVTDSSVPRRKGRLGVLPRISKAPRIPRTSVSGRWGDGFLVMIVDEVCLAPINHSAGEDCFRIDDLRPLSGDVNSTMLNCPVLISVVRFPWHHVDGKQPHSAIIPGQIGESCTLLCVVYPASLGQTRT